MVKQTNSNWGTFIIFNIVKTFQNYFTRILLPDNLSSKVALLQCLLVAAIFGGKLFGESRAGLSIVPVVPWERAPVTRGPPADQLPNIYHAVLTRLNVQCTLKRNDD